MYADLGHFGRRPIAGAWLLLVFPCLMLNYLGQGALLIRDVEAASNPFFLLAPEALRVPLVLLATAATVIASQAVISGAFSVTQQASRLNLLPRLKVLYTSETARGQIYIPVVNWLLLLAVLALVVGFQDSGSLAAAYGLAVSSDFVIGSILLIVTVLAGGARSRLFRRGLHRDPAAGLRMDAAEQPDGRRLPQAAAKPGHRDRRPGRDLSAVRTRWFRRRRCG